MRGRVPVGRDDQGGSAANRITSAGSGIVGNVGGSPGGAETVALTTAQLASHNHGVTDSGHTHTYTQPNAAIAADVAGTNQTLVPDRTAGISTSSNTTGISIQNAGSGSAHQNTQPSMIGEWIVKIA